MKIHKKSLCILFFLILPIVIIALFFKSSNTIVPLSSITEGTLFVLTTRIRRYVKLNDEVPSNLSNLPILKDAINDYIVANDNIDAWDNDFIYEVNDKEVTLISLGRDGKVGGEGEDADIIEKFNAFINLDDPFCIITFPQFRTYDTMTYIAARIQIYASNNGQLPDDIFTLPEMKFSTPVFQLQPPEYYNKTIDHWGKDIIYQRTSPTTFQLFSYGEDSKKGGIGQNSDMERIFELDDKGEYVEPHFNLRDE